MITFAEPIWILIGFIICGALFIYLYHNRKQRLERLGQFGAKILLDKLTRNVSSKKRQLKSILFISSVFCCFLALARPQYGSEWIDVKRKGIDILFALDTSKSMLTEDTRPNRLGRAKLGILDFVQQLEGDRVGLLPFAGSAFLMCPLTMDYSAFEHSLDSVDTAIIPKGGTDLSAAIKTAQTVLDNQANHKILILITDGENLEGDVFKTAASAHEEGMTIFTVGVGTREGELIPNAGSSASKYIKDQKGQFITSKLDEKTLRRIAETGGGIYAPLGSSSQGFETIYQEKLALIPKEELAEKRTKIAIERVEWPLLAAFFLLVVEYLVSGRRSGPIRIPFIQSRNRRQKKTVIQHLALLILLGSLFPGSGICSPGEDAFRAGDFITAAEYYSKRLEKEKENPEIHFNYGSAAYKNNLYDDAIASFNNALKTDDLILQAKAYYNRGNAYYRKGAETIQTDPEHTVKTWQSAIDSYDSVLNLDKKDENSRFNRELVAKKLDELKKQQQNKQNQEKEQQEEQNSKDKEKKKENDSNNAGEQPSSPQNSDKKEEGEEKEKETPAKQPEEENKSDNQTAEKNKQQAAKNSRDTEQKDTTTAAQENNESDDQQAADQQRRLLGKMTKEEAEQLLEGLKNEESELNFVPSMAGTVDSEPRRDW